MRFAPGLFLILILVSQGCGETVQTDSVSPSLPMTALPTSAPETRPTSEEINTQNETQVGMIPKPTSERALTRSTEDLMNAEEVVRTPTSVLAKTTVFPLTPMGTKAIVRTRPSETPDVETGPESLVDHVWIEHFVDTLSDLDSGAYPTSGPEIAVGDVTDDGNPEILLALEGGERVDQEGIFWRHPVFLTWNGTEFSKVDAPWMGIPQPAPDLWRPFDRQGLPYAVVVADVDQDGVNEVIVGTNWYRNPLEYGGFFIFEWDGAGFETEYADYCIGPVTRLDVLGNGAGVALSAWGKPTANEAEFDGVCPEVWQDLSAPRATLFLLTSEGPDQYHVRPVVSDQEELSSLVVNPQDPLSTQFVWFKSDGAWFWQDWATAASYNLDGQPNQNIIPPQTEYLGKYSVAADLDGDGVDEIVTLAGQNTELGDLFVWQIFQMTDSEYRMVFESRGDYVGTLYFVAGDIDNDGKEDIVDAKGRMYTWNGSQLCDQGNVIRAAGLKLQRGLESIFVGDVYGDGQNRLVFTGRPMEEKDDEGHLTYPMPGMYVIKVELPESGGICLE